LLNANGLHIIPVGNIIVRLYSNPEFSGTAGWVTGRAFGNPKKSSFSLLVYHVYPAATLDELSGYKENKSSSISSTCNFVEQFSSWLSE